MQKNNLKERFKQSIENKREENIIVTPHFLENIEFKDQLEYTEEKSLNNFLNENAHKVKKIQMVSSIVLGEIFENVKLKLGDNYRGLYEKWLELNGYNRMTALRHRNRYQLFKMCKTEKGKLFIAGLSIKVIQNIIRLEDEFKQQIILDIDSGIKKEELSSLLLENREIKNIQNVVSISLNDFSIHKINKIKDHKKLNIYKKKYEQLETSLNEIKQLLLKKEKELKK